MALWGNNDAIGAGGTVTISYVDPDWIVIGTGTTFGNVGAAGTGDVIRFGDRDGTYYGDAVIVGVASTTQVTIGSTAGLSGVGFAATTFAASQLPKYTVLDSAYSELNTDSDAYVYGLSGAETEVSKTTGYHATHAGWVGITTYLDHEGNLRVKNEVLVAMSSIENDAADDTVFPDAVITITSQPSSVGVGTTATATFSVTATVIPSSATLSYQWYEEGSVLGGETGTSVSIANTDASKDGYEYQVVVTTGDTSVTSGIATMTVS